MGSTDIHHSKEEWNSSIHIGLPRTKQMDQEEAVPYPKDSRFAAKARRLSVRYIFRLKHGLLSYRVIPLKLQALYNCTAIG